jgi:hypothetical protein
MAQNSALLAWFFTLVLVALAGRAVVRLALARGSGTLTAAARNAEVAHAAMGLGMAVLFTPGLPKPPTEASLGFFAALTAFAVFSWARRAADRLRGRSVNCGCAPRPDAHLLDPHHAIVGAAMIVMLLRPAASGGMAGMPGMTAPSGAPGVAVLVFLAYVWLAALVLGYGMTKLLPAITIGGGTSALLGSPATVYGCELAMTVLTGLMLLS